MATAPPPVSDLLKPPLKKFSPLERWCRDVVAGTVGGIVVTLVGHPFDTAKVWSASGLSVKGELAKGGMSQLYRGVQAPLMMAMFFRAMMFSAYGQAKVFFNASPENPIGYALAGGVGWGLVSVVECPQDFFKTQMQRRSIPLGQVIKESYAKNGFRGPYQGFTSTWMRNFPCAATYFFAFEMVKNHLAKQNPDGKATLSNALLAGAVAGPLYWGPWYPLDFIKIQMQSDAVLRSERKYTSWLHCARTIFKTRGLGGFYAGFSYCMMRSVPANSTMLAANDIVRTQLGLQ